MGTPWFKLYGQQYLGDPKVRMLSDADRGILVDCWAIQAAYGGVPTDPIALSRLLQRRPDHAIKAFLRVACFFVQDPLNPALMVSSRMLKEHEAYEAKLLANQINGTKGGRPPKNPLGSRVGLRSCNPNITEGEGEGEGEGEVTVPPVVPLGGQRKKRVPKEEKLKAFPVEVRRVVETLAPIWPKESAQGEKTSPTDIGLFSQRISEILAKGTDPDTLIEAAKSHIEQPRYKYSAPQYFFGVTGYKGQGEAPWVAAVRFVLTRRELASTAS
jgi:hypothetical protein